LTNSNKKVNYILNLSNLFPTKFYTSIPAEVTTFVTVATAGALATELIAAEAPGNKRVEGRASGQDNIEFELSGSFNAVKGRPNIYL